jgi:hypothetical protein
MPEDRSLAAALAAAIPGFDPPAPPPPLAADAPPEDRIDWLAGLLGEGFRCYVEWKEFDTWGMEAVLELRPVAAAGLALSLDALYDADGLPIMDEELEANPFTTELNRQLEPAGLQLVEIAMIEDGVATASENPVLVCMRRDEDRIAAVNGALEARGLMVF